MQGELGEVMSKQTIVATQLCFSISWLLFFFTLLSNQVRDMYYTNFNQPAHRIGECP